MHSAAPGYFLRNQDRKRIPAQSKIVYLKIISLAFVGYKMVEGATPLVGYDYLRSNKHQNRL